MVPDSNTPHMDVKNMQVFGSQVLHPEASAQLIQIEAVLDMSQNQTAVRLYGARPNGTLNLEVPFATATVCYEETHAPQEEWQTISHLVSARADSLWEKATSGESGVSNFSQSVAYQLFGNVVDYAARYRGMQRVAFSEDTLEASADIVLDNDQHGTWHTPPHWIDSTFQLAGFVMNSFGVQSADGKVAGSSRDFFYITPGWRHFRLLEPIEPATYRNFVRMFPVASEPGAYAGDIYLYRGEKLVGMCIGIKFKAVPRVLMPVLFPQIETGKKRNQSAETHAVKSKIGRGHSQPQLPEAAVFQKSEKLTTPPTSEVVKPQHQDQASVSQKTQSAAPMAPPVGQQPQPAKGGQDQGQNPQAAACLKLIAGETGLDLEDFTGEATFADLGVDSLMSLALSAKIRAELGIDVQASIFLECPTVQDLVTWLSK
jgi:iterative type I PKS product template protein